MMSSAGEPDDLGEQPIRALADRDFALDRLRLSFFVERHHDDARAVSTHGARLREKFFFAFFEADRVDDAFALNVLETFFEHAPLRRVDDDRESRDFGLGGDDVEEFRHRLFAVEHSFVHVHVEEVRAATNLIERDLERFVEVAFANQLGEFRGAGDVRAFTDHREIGVFRDRVGLETREARRVIGGGRDARAEFFDRARDGANVIGRRPAAPADDVDQTVARPLGELCGGLIGELVVSRRGERVGQSRVRIRAHEDVDVARETLDVRTHLRRAERAVHADGKRTRVRHGLPKRVDGLSRERASALIGDRHRDHHGHALLATREQFVDRVERGLRVERVEDRLDEEHVGAAVEQPAHLLRVGVFHLVERHCAKRRVVHLRRDATKFFPSGLPRPRRNADGHRVSPLRARPSWRAPSPSR